MLPLTPRRKYRALLRWLGPLAILLSPAVWAADAQQLAEWLGVRDAIAQADQLLARCGESPTGEDSGPVPPARRVLEQQFGSDILWQGFVARWQPAAEQLAAAAPLLSQPVALRARNFDVALAMPGALQKFQRFRRELADSDIAEARRTLLLSLDRARYTSRLAALLQVETQLACEQVLGRGGSVDALVVAEHQRQRQAFLSARLLPINLYSYRFMKDEELAEYVALMQEEPLQTLLQSAQRSLQALLLEQQHSLRQQLAVP